MEYKLKLMEEYFYNHGIAITNKKDAKIYVKDYKLDIMKVKGDFVTNSSSTCFIVYGYIFSKEEIIENEILMDKLYEYNKNKNDPEITKNDFYKEMKIGDSNLSDVFFNYANDFNLSSSSLCDDEFAVGVSPFNIKNDETGKEFKERVKNILIEITGNQKIKPYEIEESWRDE